MKVPSINTCEAKKGQVERLKRECRASRFPRVQIDSMLYIFFKFIDSKLKKNKQNSIDGNIIFEGSIPTFHLFVQSLCLEKERKHLLHWLYSKCFLV